MLKRYSSFYYVQHNKKIWECRLRGKQRLKKEDVIAGDRVLFTAIDDTQGIIEEILPRTNELYRPAIANVTQLLIIQSLKTPEPNFALLDRLLVLGAHSNLKCLIAFNKIDLVGDEIIDEVKAYENIGYKVLFVSAKQKKGIENLKIHLSDEITVLAGVSGVGKSSLINALEDDFSLKVGSVSDKSETGKHTTRYVQLLPLSFGGLVADTPGFSRLYLPSDLKREDLSFLFPEMEKVHHQCRFSNCIHREEPGCKVKEEVEVGLIPNWRYDNYLQFLDEIITRERSY